MTRVPRKFNRQRGSIAVQSAILLPAFFGAVLGIFYFGLAFYAQSSIGYAAREGARYAIVHGSKSSTPATAADVEAFARNRMSGLLANQATVSVSFSPNNTPGSDVIVVASYTLGPSAALLGVNAMTFSRTVRMTILQ